MKNLAPINENKDVISKEYADGAYSAKTHTHSYAGSASAGGAANSAVKLGTARTIQTNLASATAESFDGTKDITPGVTGTLPIANGGTGKTSANAAANAFINSLTVGTATPGDNDYYVSQATNGGTTTTTYHRRPLKALWEYMKGKISSVLGLTATEYEGNAGTATKLATPREINGIEFDGTKDIKIPSSTLPICGASGVSGTNGYINVAQIKIAGIWLDTPITISYVTRHGVTGNLYIQFAGSSGTDPTIIYFKYISLTGHANVAYLYKSATSTWELYIKKNEAYCMTRITNAFVPTGINITWKSAVQVSSLPDGYVAATLANANIAGNAATATKAINDSDGNKISTTYIKKMGGQLLYSGAFTSATSASVTIADLWQYSMLMFKITLSSRSASIAQVVELIVPIQYINSGNTYTANQNIISAGTTISSSKCATNFSGAIGFSKSDTANTISLATYTNSISYIEVYSII